MVLLEIQLELGVNMRVSSKSKIELFYEDQELDHCLAHGSHSVLER